jgi:hypothetical protein
VYVARNVITTLLFDFNSVVVDTEVPTFESWRDRYADMAVTSPLGLATRSW